MDASPARQRTVRDPLANGVVHLVDDARDVETIGRDRGFTRAHRAPPGRPPPARRPPRRTMISGGENATEFAYGSARPITPRASSASANAPGSQRRLKPDRLHQALAAHLGHARMAEQPIETRAQTGARRPRRARAILGRINSEVGHAGRAARRMAAVRAAVREQIPRIGLEPAPQPRTDDHAAERQVSARDRLGERHQVGRDAVVVGGEPRAEPAEAGDHLVEDQQRAALVAQLPQTLQIALGGREHAAGADHRLGHDRRDPLRAVVGDGVAHRREAVAVDLEEVGQQRPERIAVGGQAAGRGAAEHHAVVGVVPAEEHLASAVARRLVRPRARTSSPSRSPRSRRR